MTNPRQSDGHASPTEAPAPCRSAQALNLLSATATILFLLVLAAFIFNTPAGKDIPGRQWMAAFNLSGPAFTSPPPDVLSPNAVLPGTDAMFISTPKASP
jgi:hypothetical protein